METNSGLVDERTNLTSTNRFELLLFRLGAAPGGDDLHELYGINIFKIREIMQIPSVTPIPGSSEFVLGAVDIRGQVMPVINLSKVMGCDPTVFRPSNSTWFIARTSAGTQIVQFGSAGDRPIPNAFVP